MSSKTKGSSFERKVCKMLSLWWTSSKRDDIFWRTAGSGGRATVRKKKGKNTYNQHGDICAVDPIGEPLLKLCTIEVKRGYKGWCVLDLVDAKGKESVQKLKHFMVQARMESHEAGVPWYMIICQRDRRTPIIVIPTELIEMCYVSNLQFNKTSMITYRNYFTLTVIMDLKDFFKLVSAKEIRREVKLREAGIQMRRSRKPYHD